MKKSLMIVLTLGFVIPGLLATVACTKKKAGVKQTLVDTSAADQAALDAKKQRELDAKKQRQIAVKAKQEKAARLIAEAQERFLNDHVHFSYDSAVLTPIAQTVLNQKADWLRINASKNVIIGGHCDERGTVEYNVALGERRAEAAKKYIIDLGINASRLESVSYGEEMPLATGNNEEAWAQNRRAQFEIK